MTAGRASAGGPDTPPLRLAVCGAGAADDALVAVAEAVGRDIALAGAVLVCGGRGGVMEAAARGAGRHGGITIGVLPGASAAEANEWIQLPLPTGMGEARNALVVRFADAVIAIGGEWGTLSEVALARAMAIPVVLLTPGITDSLGLETAQDAADAVRRALRHARGQRNR